jgi:hypothetical protein
MCQKGKNSWVKRPAHHCVFMGRFVLHFSATLLVSIVGNSRVIAIGDWSRIIYRELPTMLSQFDIYHNDHLHA